MTCVSYLNSLCSISCSNIFNIFSELKSKRKDIVKELQSRTTGLVVQKTDISEQDSLKPKKPPKTSLLPVFYSISKRQSQSIADLRKLLLFKENPCDILPYDITNEPSILDIFGPNTNMKNLVNLNGK